MQLKLSTVKRLIVSCLYPISISEDVRPLKCFLTKIIPILISSLTKPSMKFCKPRLYEYTGVNGNNSSFNYVTDNDVEMHHGKDFYDKWKEYMNAKPYMTHAGEIRYYYYDYKECAYKAQCWFV